VILVERQRSWVAKEKRSAMYRIVTEDKNVEGIKAALVGFDLDFTLFRGIGSWRGKEGESLAVELDRISRETAEMVARTIKTLNDQETVLLQEFPIKTDLL
jgi:hypothetical protein